MSTILKALRRLEEDRQGNAAIDLRESVIEPQASRPHSRAGWILVAAGLLAAAGIGGAAFSIAERAAAPPAEVAAVPEAPAANGALVANAAPASTTTAPPAPAPSAPAPVAPPAPAPPVVAAQAPPVAAPLVQPPRPAVPQVVAQRLPEPAPAVSAPAPRAPIPKPVAQAPRPAPVPAVVPPAATPESALTEELDEQPADDQLALEESARLLALARSGTVPPMKRTPLSDFTVLRTVWHPDANRRVAVFELREGGERLRVGEGEVVAGFVVSKIGLSGVELARDGVVIERRLGD